MQPDNTPPEGPERIFGYIEESRIANPRPQERLPVSWDDWDFLKARIRRCEIRLDLWGMATSFFFGVAALALSVALSSDASSVATRWLDVYWSLGIGGVIVGMACFIARMAIVRAQHQSVNSVLEDMARIEQRYERPNQAIQGL